MRLFKRSKVAAAALVIAALTLATVSSVQARFDLGSVLKIGGVALLVKQYDKPIDNFINKTLGEKQAAVRGATKVVPILSLGGGGYIGAAQVVGAAPQVQRTKFVIQVEMKLLGSLRGKLLVPTGSKPTGGSVERMKGVGVSAIVEFKI